MVFPLNRPARALLLCWLLALSAPAPARVLGRFSGVVVGVTDGDTIRVLVAGREVAVRLHGVDAPESHQAYGTRARQFTSDLVFGKPVRVDVKDRDRWGRLVGEVWIGGWNVNRELVRAGLAWWYRDFAPRDAELAALERQVRTARLWKGFLACVAKCLTMEPRNRRREAL